LDLGISGGDVTSGGVFAFFWTILPGPGREPNQPYFWFEVFLETRPKSASLEPLIDLLEPKL